jgi:hexokinase
MIPTYIETDEPLPQNEQVIVIDAGGTNFRAAVVHFDDNNKAVIENLTKAKMPGIEKEISNDEFFDILAGYTKEVADKSDKIGFCFSYPVDMYPSKDGRLVQFSKEIKADEVIGQMIGENLLAAMKRLSLSNDKQVVILNDTVTTLLASYGNKDYDGYIGFILGTGTNTAYDGYIGFILGTGTNTAYIEKNSNITKLNSLPSGKNQIINIESGGYSRAPRGTIDNSFDAKTDVPDTQLLEKMISGAYLGPLCLEVIKTAAANDLFTSIQADRINRITSLDTKAVSDFLAEPIARNNALGEVISDTSNYDKAVMESLVDAVITRAAKLTAVNLSAAVIKSGKGTDPDKPVCIVAEGTTFYYLTGMKEKIEKYLEEFLTDNKKRYYEIVNVENATLIGAAIAGLTN